MELIFQLVRDLVFQMDYLLMVIQLLFQDVISVMMKGIIKVEFVYLIIMEVLGFNVEMIFWEILQIKKATQFQ